MPTPLIAVVAAAAMAVAAVSSLGVASAFVSPLHPASAPTRGLTTSIKTARDMMTGLPSSSEGGDSAASKGGCPVLRKKDEGEPPMYDIPVIFSPEDSRPVVLFDGSCNLCNAAVQRLLDYDSCSKDPRGNLRVAALQSRVGELLCRRLPESVREEVLAPPRAEEQYKSIVVCAPDQTYTKTRAVLLIGRSLGGKLKILRYLCFLGYAVPPFVRDRAYGWFSRRRRRWFGSSAECRLWDDNFDQRFVDDGVLTGMFRDPFADPNAPPPAPPEGAAEGLVRGDRVRITYPGGEVDPTVIYYEPSHPDGLCLTGATGTLVTIDLPMRMVVRLDRDSLGLGDGDDMLTAVKPLEVCRLED